MTARERTSMSDIVGRYEDQLLPEWVQQQLEATTLRCDLMNDEELKIQSRRFLGALRKVLQNGSADQDITAPSASSAASGRRSPRPWCTSAWTSRT